MMIVSKWKCEICEKKFDNFHAQGFDSKIYCPLCFFKEKTNRLEKENAQLKDKIEKIEEWLKYKVEALDTFDIPKRKETGAFWFTTRGEIDGLLELLKEN